ncbi:MAG: N-acetyltransferase family protein [Xanthobacteraceae bacterium]
MSELIIRPSGPRDVAAIARIYADAVAHGTASFELEPPTEAEMARRQQELLNGGYPYFVAERDGAITGYAYAGPYRARPAYRWCAEDSIYVAPEFHRQGIGRLLLARLVTAAEQTGFRQMIAVIGDSAQVPSIALHEAAGFSFVGTLRSVGFKHGKWLDTPLMQIALGDGDQTPP